MKRLSGDWYFRTGLTRWRIGLVSLFMIATGYGQAQSYKIDFTREGAWRYTYQPETIYQQNGRVIDHQLRGISNRLNRLSIANPPVYSIVQRELHDYLYRLEQQNPDYGNTAIYHAVLLRLTAIEKSVNDALSSSRQPTIEDSPDTFAVDLYPSKPAPGGTLQLRPYAILFQRANYRSKVVHIVTSRETVRLLRRGEAYQYVQCGKHQGYLGTGMIIGITP